MRVCYPSIQSDAYKLSDFPLDPALCSNKIHCVILSGAKTPRILPAVAINFKESPLTSWNALEKIDSLSWKSYRSERNAGVLRFAQDDEV